jgi:hypothetical protein
VKRAISRLINHGVDAKGIFFCSCDGLSAQNLRRMVRTAHARVRPTQGAGRYWWFLDEVTGVRLWFPVDGDQAVARPGRLSQNPAPTVGCVRNQLDGFPLTGGEHAAGNDTAGHPSRAAPSASGAALGAVVGISPTRTPKAAPPRAHPPALARGARERDEVQRHALAAGRRSPGRLLDAALRPRSELSTSGQIGSEASFATACRTQNSGRRASCSPAPPKRISTTRQRR